MAITAAATLNAEKEAETLPYLIDTNILVHSIRRDATGEMIRMKYSLLMQEIRPIISVVTEGEIRSLAYQFGWGADKTERMHFLLGYFGRAPLDTPAMMEAYALIDAHSERVDHSMGKNDIWIAATAHVNGAFLLTTDKDFDHLTPLFLALERIS